MTDFLDGVLLEERARETDSSEQSPASDSPTDDSCAEMERARESAAPDVCPEFPRSPLGATDALDALPTTRDEREALRARGVPVAAAEPEDPHVPAGPRCRACGSIHGVWVKVHWKPGAVAGDRPCPEGFKP